MPNTVNHAALADGLRLVFTMLIRLSYLQESDVRWSIDPSEVWHVPARVPSLDATATVLIAQLPSLTSSAMSKYAASEDGIQLAPGSQAVSYSAVNHSDEQDLRYVMNGSEELGPLQIKVARCGGSDGVDLVYDMRDGTITNFDLNGDASTPSNPTPAVIFFETWTKKLETLEWLPWIDGETTSIEKKPSPPVTNVDPRMAMNMQYISNLDLPQGSSLQFLSPGNDEGKRAVYNAFMAKYSIYIQAGWPDRFDTDEFVRSKDTWNAQKGEAMSNWRYGPGTGNVYHVQGGQALRDFYRLTAGRYAI